MDFNTISTLIDDIVGFINDFIAKLKKFVAGFKTDIDLVIPGTDAE